tara:strand:+ start:2368 stop:2565 length:198 start_codon:yes stop_codon:yes gene_type:complete
MTRLKKLQERLQKLNQDRSQLSISYNQFTGAIMEIERQIIEEQEVIKEDTNLESLKSHDLQSYGQ